MSNLDQVLEKKQKDDTRRRKNNEKQREELKAAKERQNKWREKFMKKPRVLFTYERMEDGFSKFEPRDVRTKLEALINKRYDGKPLSNIPFSTELYLRYFNGKRILKFQVTNVEWEEGIETRTMKKVIYSSKMFRWLNTEEPNEFDIIEESYCE